MAVANVLLHVREHPEGRVIVTPVDFPELSVDGDDYGAALRAVRSRVTQRLRTISGSVRNMFAAPVVAELERVEIALARRRTRSAPLRITIGLVVRVHESSTGLIYIVHAPEIPDFSLSVQMREAVRGASVRELTNMLSNWELDHLLASDDVRKVSLETITMPFPKADEPQLTRGDDKFSVEEAGD